MTIKQLRKRWENTQFLEDNFELLARVFQEKKSLTDSDLRGIVVGLENGVQLFPIMEFMGSQISNAQFSYARFSCSFNNSLFDGCNFCKAYFDTCRMSRARFSQCDFTGARIDSPWLEDAEVIECDFSESTFRSRGFREYGGRRVIFRGCNFTNATLANLQLRATKFYDCQFANVCIRKCILAGIVFETSHPEASSIVDCDLHSIQYL